LDFFLGGKYLILMGATGLRQESCSIYSKHARGHGGDADFGGSRPFQAASGSAGKKAGLPP
jgi:hypothetical protein